LIMKILSTVFVPSVTPIRNKVSFFMMQYQTFSLCKRNVECIFPKTISSEISPVTWSPPIFHLINWCSFPFSWNLSVISNCILPFSQTGSFFVCSKWCLPCLKRYNVASCCLLLFTLKINLFTSWTAKS
jgi:hypothetical protein